MGLGALIGMGPKLKGYEPNKKNLRYYEGQQRKGIQSLYGGRPYESPELGFSKQQMEGRFGARGAEFASARAGEEQTISNAFSRFGGRHLAGTEWRARQRARQNDLARRSGQRRSMMLADAGQRREDWGRRHGATTGAYNTGVGMFNVAKRMAYGADLQRAQAVGRAVRGIATMGGSEMAGGNMMNPWPNQ